MSERESLFSFRRFGQDKRIWNLVTPWFVIAWGYSPMTPKRRRFAIYAR